MSKNLKTEVVLYHLNGCEEDAKFIEIDGEKFEVDPDDATKPKQVDGKNVPFKEEEKAPEETPEEKKIREAKEEAEKGGKSIEELAKDNPELQKILDANKKREADDKKAEEERKKKEEEEAEKKNEWKDLAGSRKTELEAKTKELEQKEEILGKYVNSVKSVLKDVMATIPKENVGLIPDGFSPREKLEYITKNAKVLGAKITGSGGGVSPNDKDVQPTDEAKLQSEIDDLRKKPELEKTKADHTKIFELSKKLKDLRAANQGKTT